MSCAGIGSAKVFERVTKRQGFFFFEKKKQKTFVHLCPRSHSNRAMRPIDKSLVASFSSEKEESLSFVFAGSH
jgi:hypothetical protein